MSKVRRIFPKNPPLPRGFEKHWELKTINFVPFLLSLLFILLSLWFAFYSFVLSRGGRCGPQRRLTAELYIYHSLVTVGLHSFHSKAEREKKKCWRGANGYQAQNEIFFASITLFLFTVQTLLILFKVDFFLLWFLTRFQLLNKSYMLIKLRSR